VPAAAAQEGSTASVNVIPVINTPSVFVTVMRQNAVEPGATGVDAAHGPTPPGPQNTTHKDVQNYLRISKSPTVTEAGEGGVVTGGAVGLPGMGADAVTVFVNGAVTDAVAQ
jgi:hypothetical protein